MPSTIEAKELPLGNIFSDAYLFEIPEYQRPYSWTTEEVSALLGDVFRAMSGDDKIGDLSPYFLGSIVLVKDTRSPRSQIVDGQQRITTLAIMLCILREIDNDNRLGLDDLIRQKGIVARGTEDVFRLTLRSRDAKFFQGNVQIPGELKNFLEENSASMSDSQQRILENARYLWKELSDIDAEKALRLTQFLSQRCYLVVVSTSDRNSAYRIFSVMNDRGLDLSPTDILKSEIIGDMDESVRSQYTEKWEDIEDGLGRDGFRDLFAHIRMIYMKARARETLNQEFSDNVLAQLEGKNFVDDVLVPFADVYETVNQGDYESRKNADKINLYLRYLRRLDNFDWIPPAMAFFNRNPSDTDSLRFVRDLERLAYGMFVRRANVNERANRYAAILRDIEQGDDLYHEDASPIQLADWEKGEIIDTLNGQLYNAERQSRVCTLLLLRLDSLLADSGASYDHPIISVEHVLPRNPKQSSEWLEEFSDEDRTEWTGKLANLVLLSRRKNSQAQNYEFERKKSAYFQRRGTTTFALTTQVINESKWTPKVLERRQKCLIDALKKEWRLD